MTINYKKQKLVIKKVIYYMLNLSKIKLNAGKQLNVSKNEKEDKVYYLNQDKTRHFPPANKEWYNSIYTYNKSSTKLLPILDNSVLKLIRGYFSMYSKNLENKVKTPRLRMWMRRSSLKRILISKAELKHTSDKVIITLYVFNRQKTYYLNKIAKLNRWTGSQKMRLTFLKKIKILKAKSLELVSKINKIKEIFFETLNWKMSDFKDYEKRVYINFLKKSFRREILLIYYKQILFINKSKFKSTYLIPFKSIVENIYKKKVEFNLVSLKYFHFNSDIYLQILMIKLRNRKNKILKVLKKSLAKIRLPSLIRLVNLSNIYRNKSFKLGKENMSRDILSTALSQHSLENSNLTLQEDVYGILGTIRNKTFSGIRVEASGRLTKRITASRALSKVKYVGNLKNIDSSFRNASSVIFRGNIKSNLSYMKSKSKTRIGSYGLKSWINNF